jgi:hypothetical protein
LVKIDKPTGDTGCPAYMDHAHTIEEAMNEKGGSHDLDNDEMLDGAISISSDDNNNNDPPSPKKKAVMESKPGTTTHAPITA